MKTFKACIALAVVAALCMYAYVIYLADYASQLPGGYGMSMFIIPSAFGVLSGGIVARFLVTGSERGWGRYWWVVPYGVFFANLPSLYYIVFMVFFMEGS